MSTALDPKVSSSFFWWTRRCADCRCSLGRATSCEGCLRRRRSKRQSSRCRCQRGAVAAPRGGVRRYRICAVLWSAVRDIRKSSTGKQVNMSDSCRSASGHRRSGVRLPDDGIRVRLLYDGRRPTMTGPRPQVAARLTMPALARARLSLRSQSACSKPKLLFTQDNISLLVIVRLLDMNTVSFLHL